MPIVKRALISCSDKAGLPEFARGLTELGVELVASSGTAAFLAQHGIAAKTVEAFTGSGEQLDGRVKTLHPRIFSGILARRDDPAHVKAVGDGLIDLVAVNLYPFQQAVQRVGITLAEALEQIDIGGVALLRAAAKNFLHVAVVSEPSQYPAVLEALRRRRGALPEATSRMLAQTAWALTSGYDAAISQYLTPAASEERLPDTVTASLRRRQSLRYGENPHQRAGWYEPSGAPSTGLAQIVQRQGKELSYNNLLDLDAIVRCVTEFARPTCVIVKHASPCGLGSAETVGQAYARALAGDPESAFGGIVGLNRPLDAATAQAIAATFYEVIVAPSIETAAMAVFAKKPNLRLLELDAIGREASAGSSIDWRMVQDGWLLQDRDDRRDDSAAWRVATARRPSDQELRDLTFAWTACKHVKSNAIVVAGGEATYGIGQGQPSRVRAVRLAIQNAGARARGAVLASDGFFPFPDSVELAAAAGITALIQPGGSVKDPEVIAAADRAGLAMVVTGVRHFRH